jgi:hypothetical protein
MDNGWKVDNYGRRFNSSGRSFIDPAAGKLQLPDSVGPKILRERNNNMFDMGNRPQFTTGEEHFRRPRINPLAGIGPRPGGPVAPGAPGDTPSAPLPAPDFSKMPPQSPLQGGPAGRRFPRFGMGMPHGRGGPRDFGPRPGGRPFPFGRRQPGMMGGMRRPPHVWNAPGAQPGMPNMARGGRPPRVPGRWRRPGAPVAPTAAPMAAPAPIDPNQPV